MLMLFLCFSNQICSTNDDYNYNGSESASSSEISMTLDSAPCDDANQEENLLSEPSEAPKPEVKVEYQRTLSGGLRSPKADVPRTAILQRINSKKAAKSYQLGHQLSNKWSTGAGPRIGCIVDYPVELRLQALELTNLSPRSCPKLSPSPRSCTPVFTPGRIPILDSPSACQPSAASNDMAQNHEH